jgi:Mn-dependent DtxR family transcriptional regulator
MLSRKGERGLSASMEDYLEMIFRLSAQAGYTRVLELASALHVQPPSATTMIQRLAHEGLVAYERYGTISLTDEGKQIGVYLLHRHNVLEEFLVLLGVANPLIDAERIEHNISDEAMAGIGRLLAFFASNPEHKEEWLRTLRT